LVDPDENNCAEQMHGSHPLAGYELSANQQLFGLQVVLAAIGQN